MGDSTISGPPFRFVAPVWRPLPQTFRDHAIVRPPVSPGLLKDAIGRPSLPTLRPPTAVTRQTLFDEPETLPGEKPAPGTEFYNMDGEFLGRVVSDGKKPRVMVDETAYENYLTAYLASAAAQRPDAAPRFVDGVITALTKEENATCKDLIARETGTFLSFTGKAGDFNIGGKVKQVRQVGRGTLDFKATFDNARQAEIASFSAVSGPMNNGLIPNGRYKALAPMNAVNQFPDETGKFGFKMVLVPGEAMKRGDFRIHSVFGGRYHKGSGTEGCVGLNGGHAENVAFHELMTTYFKTHKSITLNVDIAGNANVKTQLGTQDDYRSAEPPAVGIKRPKAAKK